MKRILSALLTAWLAVAPAAALANGARLLIPTGQGAQPAKPDTGPAPVFNQIVANTGTNSVGSATFGSTPTTNDWLIAITTITGGVYTPTSGWTAVETINNCNTAPQLVILYHQVVGGDGTSYSPITNSQTIWSVDIIDVTSGRGTWAALLQQIISNCAGTSTVTVTGTGPTNTGVFATGFINVATSGSLSANPTMTGVTGGAQASHVNGGGGSSQGIIGAQTSLTGSAFPSVSASPSGAGTNINEAVGVLIMLNPG